MFRAPVFTQDALQPDWQVVSGLDHLCACVLYCDFLERYYLCPWLLISVVLRLTQGLKHRSPSGPRGAETCVLASLSGPAVGQLNDVTAATVIQQVFAFQPILIRTFYYHKSMGGFARTLCWVINQQRLTVKPVEVHCSNHLVRPSRNLPSSHTALHQICT